MTHFSLGFCFITVIYDLASYIDFLFNYVSKWPNFIVFLIDLLVLRSMQLSLGRDVNEQKGVVTGN